MSQSIKSLSRICTRSNIATALLAISALLFTISCRSGSTYELRDNGPIQRQALPDYSSDADASSFPLHQAVVREDESRIDALLTVSPNLANQLDRESRTPLHLASALGQRATVEKMIQAGARVDTTDESGNSAIHFAIHQGEREIVTALIEAGGRVDIRNSNKRSAVDEAIYRGEADLIEIVVNADRRHRPDNYLQRLASESLANNHRPVLLYTLRSGFEATADTIHTAYQAQNPELAMLLYTTAMDQIGLDELPIQRTTLLHQASQHGFKEIVLRLIEEKININSSYNYNPPQKVDQRIMHSSDMTALMRSILYEHYDLATLLIQRGADVNIADGVGNSALHYAATGNLPLVELLLASGAYAPARNHEGRAALHIAALHGHRAIAEQLLERGAEIDQLDQAGNTPLNLAVIEKRIGVVELLINRDADIHSPIRSGGRRDLARYNGKPIFYWAAEETQLEILHMLINKGIDLDMVVETESADEWRLLLWATRTNNKEIVMLLLEKEADYRVRLVGGNTLLHWAVYHNYDDIVDFLLKEEFAINDANDDGDTPLHIAANVGHRGIAEQLLTARASITITNDEESLPLHYAAYHGHKEIVEILIRRGSSIDAKSFFHNTPLILASFAGQTEVVEELLRAGAKVEEKSRNQWNALHWAAYNGYPAVVRQLLTKVDSEKIDEVVNLPGYSVSNWSALHLAAVGGHAEVVELLIEAGANADLRDAKDFNPMHVAATNGHQRIVTLLLEAGAKN